MDTNTKVKRDLPHPRVTSELNNLLQVMAGTSAMIENLWDGNPGAEKYFEMLRVSIDRAARLTAEMVRQADGCDDKMLLRRDLAATPSPPVDRPRVIKATVLVVDDEPMALTLAQKILGAAGYAVVIARSGFECLDLIRKQPGRIDLVFLDLTMPLMDGEETFNRIRELNLDLPVILSTGFIDRERLDHMLAAGLAGFMLKPLHPDELTENIRSVLARAESQAHQSHCRP